MSQARAREEENQCEPSRVEDDQGITTYLIRGPYHSTDLHRLYRQFVSRYGQTLTFRRWLVERGKVYKRKEGQKRSR